VPDRLFTPDEANSALSEVRPVAERLVALRARMRELEQGQGSLVTVIAGNGTGYAAGDLNDAQSELAGLAEAAVACVERLEELGVQVKDVDTGLLDFPCRVDDQVVLLCWRMGETTIEHWHTIEDGFKGRKPVDERFRRRSNSSNRPN